jgi:hypothetical protein
MRPTHRTTEPTIVHGERSSDSAVSPSASPQGDPLTRVLSEIQRRGGIGRGPIEAAIAHAEQFVTALPDDLPTSARLVDLGSGGGLPGLVIIARRPDLHVTLVERRAKRADLLRYGVRALDADRRVEVIADDVARLVERAPRSFDVVTARSFAAPEMVANVAGALLGTHGIVLVSEPPERVERWSSGVLDAAGLRDGGRLGSIRRLRR